MNEVAVRSESIIEKKLDDELIIVNTNQNELNSLSPSGQEIWGLIDGKRSVDNIIDILCDRYQIKRQDAPCEIQEPEAIGEVLCATGETMESQVRSFISMLTDRGLLRAL